MFPVFWYQHRVRTTNGVEPSVKFCACFLRQHRLKDTNILRCSLQLLTLPLLSICPVLSYISKDDPALIDQVNFENQWSCLEEKRFCIRDMELKVYVLLKFSYLLEYSKNQSSFSKAFLPQNCSFSTHQKFNYFAVSSKIYFEFSSHQKHCQQ